jgi:hypothetical protein
MRNTADVIGGKPIAVLLQSISGGGDVNALVAFYNIHGSKRDVPFFCSIPDTTRDTLALMMPRFKVGNTFAGSATINWRFAIMSENINSYCYRFQVQHYKAHQVPCTDVGSHLRVVPVNTSTLLTLEHRDKGSHKARG